MISLYRKGLVLLISIVLYAGCEENLSLQKEHDQTVSMIKPVKQPEIKDELNQVGQLFMFDVFLPDAEMPMPDAEMPMPDAKMPMPDAEMPMPDAEMPMPDAEMPMPDAEMPMPDAEMPMPDAEMPNEQGRACDKTITNDCHLPYTCLINPDSNQQWTLPTPLNICDTSPEITQNTSVGLPCDIEQVRYQCPFNAVCFDPVEWSDTMEDHMLLSEWSNHAGFCLRVREIQAEGDEYSSFILDYEQHLFALHTYDDAILQITSDQTCITDHTTDTEVRFALRIFKESIAGELELLWSNDATQSCHVNELSLEGDTHYWVQWIAQQNTNTDYQITFQVDYVDRDQDGTADYMDCAPEDPMIPQEQEILNNMIDDDCDPLTSDDNGTVGSVCDRTNFGLGCEIPYICLQGDTEGVGVCGEIPVHIENLGRGDRCDGYQIQNLCIDESMQEELYCFDGIVENLARLYNESNEESLIQINQYLNDGDGKCLPFIDNLERPSGTHTVNQDYPWILFRYFNPLISEFSIIFTADNAENCPSELDFITYRHDFNQAGLIQLEIIQAQHVVGAMSTDDDDYVCAELIMQSDSHEVYVLLGYQDLMSLQGTLSWNVIEEMIEP